MTVGGNEIKAAVNSVVDNVPSVQTAFVSQVAFKLVVNVLNYRSETEKLRQPKFRWFVSLFQERCGTTSRYCRSHRQILVCLRPSVAVSRPFPQSPPSKHQFSQFASLSLKEKTFKCTSCFKRQMEITSTCCGGNDSFRIEVRQKQTVD